MLGAAGEVRPRFGCRRGPHPTGPRAPEPQPGPAQGQARRVKKDLQTLPPHGDESWEQLVQPVLGLVPPGATSDSGEGGPEGTLHTLMGNQWSGPSLSEIQ